MSSYYYTNRIDTFEEEKGLTSKTALGRFLANITEGKNLLILLPIPIVAFVTAALITTHISSGREKTMQERRGLAAVHSSYYMAQQQYDSINQAALYVEAEDTARTADNEPPPVFKKRAPILSSDVLEQRHQINLALLNKQNAGANLHLLGKPKEEIIRDQQGQIKFISGMIAILRPTLENSGEIARHIVELSHEKHVDPLFVASIISVESMFKSDAKSHVGAMGLMQLMPATAQDLAKKQNTKLHDPRTNISLGIDYLIWLEKKYHGNRTYMLTAYNWGPGNVDRVIQGNARTPSDVSKYASTIIKRANDWKRHYKAAEVETTNISAKL